MKVITLDTPMLEASLIMAIDSAIEDREKRLDDGDWVSEEADIIQDEFRTGREVAQNWAILCRMMGAEAMAKDCDRLAWRYKDLFAVSVSESGHGDRCARCGDSILDAVEDVDSEGKTWTYCSQECMDRH